MNFKLARAEMGMPSCGALCCDKNMDLCGLTYANCEMDGFLEISYLKHIYKENT